MAEMKEVELTRKGFHMTEKAKRFWQRVLWFGLGAFTGATVVGIVSSSGGNTEQIEMDTMESTSPIDE